MNEKDIAEQSYKNGYAQALKDIVPDGYRATWKLKFFAAQKENERLQKQVDELKQELEKAYEIERANIQAEIAEAGTSCHWCKQQTVKDTAKEIFDKIFFYRNRKDTTNFDTILLNMAKEHGVEVE